MTTADLITDIARIAFIGFNNVRIIDALNRIVHGPKGMVDRRVNHDIIRTGWRGRFFSIDEDDAFIARSRKQLLASSDAAGKIA